MPDPQSRSMTCARSRNGCFRRDGRADRADRHAWFRRPITAGDILVDVGDKAVPLFVVISCAIPILRPSGARDTLVDRGFGGGVEEVGADVVGQFFRNL
jgi:hypothetical protein